MIELMIVIAILAVLSAIAAPSFSQLIKQQKIRALSLDLYGDLVLARSEAIKRNATIALVPKDSGTSKNWAKGWDVIVDGTATTLKSQEAQSADYLATGANGVRYGSAGRSVDGAVAITVKETSLNSSDWRCLSIDLSGRPSSKTGGC